MVFNNLTGQTLGGCQIRQLIGEGGMGMVYEGYQQNLGRTVAIKVLPAHFAESSDDLKRFNREARMLASLEHPHILPVYDYGTDSGYAYIVMRRLTGGTLAQRLNECIEPHRPLPSPGEIATIIQQIAYALDYAAERNVIHRDIKPNNIMFDGQGTAYLMDFGIARLLEDQTVTRTGQTVGTPTYMAPEQWKAADIGPATDIYALAAVTYTLLCGRPPFEADNPYTLMAMHMESRPASVRDVRPALPDTVDRVLLRGMAKNPQKRYSSARAFAQAFAEAIAGYEGDNTGFTTFKLRSLRKLGFKSSSSSKRVKQPAASSRQVTITINNRTAIAGGLVLLVAVMLIAVIVFMARQFGGPDNAPPTDNVGGGANSAVSASPTTAASEPTAPIVANMMTHTPLPLVKRELPTATNVPPTATPTTIPATHTPAPTNTTVPTAAPTATATVITLPYAVALTPVSRNANWTPIERDFNGVPMVLVPAGCFVITSGENAEAPNLNGECVNTPVWLDKYEVTNGRYGSTGCETWSDAANQPRNCVTWFEARDFCIAQGGRLPTAIEWLYASGGPEGWVFPWGDAWESDYANWGDTLPDKTFDVGRFPSGVSWVGAHDMSGNIYEWVASESNGQRMLFGGSFVNPVRYLRHDFHLAGPPDYENYDLGFRCARDFSSPAP